MTNAEFNKWFALEWVRITHKLTRSGFDFSKIRLVKKSDENPEQFAININEIELEEGTELELLVTQKHFYKLFSGEIKEDYREIKPYYTSRFISWMGFPKSFKWGNVDWFLNGLEHDNSYSKLTRQILFKTGYGQNAKSFLCECGLRIGTGKEEWGAEPNMKYFIIDIKKII